MRQTNTTFLEADRLPKFVGRSGAKRVVHEITIADSPSPNTPARFTGQVLDGQDWSKMSLPLADFSNTSANDCNFENADLFGADFSGASLRNAVFTNCDLRGCNFALADLTGAVLRDTDLRPGKYSPREACGTEVAAFSIHALAGQQAPEQVEAGAAVQPRLVSANFAGADLTDSDLSGATMRKANLAGSTLKNACFENCDLTETNFLNCDLSCALTRGSNICDALTGLEIEPRPEWFQMTLERHRVWIESDGVMGERANLSGMTLRNLDLSNCDLRGALLMNVLAIGTNFSGSNLAFANFSNAKLRGANFESTVLNGANFSGACLAGASLRGASIEPVEIFDKSNESTGRAWAARFVDSNLEGADFRGAVFKEAVFQNTVVHGAMWGEAAG